MALSLPGERSIVAGSRVNPVRAFAAWFAQAKAARTRRTALRGLLELDPSRLDDLGVSRSDIDAAIAARNGWTSGMILTAARARNAQV